MNDIDDCRMAIVGYKEAVDAAKLLHDGQLELVGGEQSQAKESDWECAPWSIVDPTTTTTVMPQEKSRRQAQE